MRASPRRWSIVDGGMGNAEGALTYEKATPAGGSDPPVRVAVDHVTKSFQGSHGQVTPALEDVSFSVGNAEVVSVVGTSGCGKTTLLRIIDGLIRHDSGKVIVGNQLVTGPGRDRAMVFQHSNLLPWRSAIRNVELGLELHGVGRRERQEAAERALYLVGLEGFASHYPSQLSGGMQQRIGLARALATNPSVLLMDEPFGALDALTREELQRQLLDLHLQTEKTIVFVTHDLDEAVYLGDRVVVMAAQPGRVRQIVEVPVPRPRAELPVVRTTDAFREARDAITALIRERGDRQKTGEGIHVT